MKTAFFSLLLFVSLTAFSHACTTPTLTSFSLSPGSISGDQSEFATGSVQACLPPGSTTLNLYIGPAAR